MMFSNLQKNKISIAVSSLSKSPHQKMRNTALILTPSKCLRRIIRSSQEATVIISNFMSSKETRHPRDLLFLRHKQRFAQFPHGMQKTVSPSPAKLGKVGIIALLSIAQQALCRPKSYYSFKLYSFLFFYFKKVYRRKIKTFKMHLMNGAMSDPSVQEI